MTADEGTTEPKPTPLLGEDRQQQQQPPPPPYDPDTWRADKHTVMSMACLIVVTFVVAIDATILVPALTTIATSLRGTTTETFWAGTSYLLTSSTFQPLLGALSGVLGRRRIYLTAVSLFTIGTLVASRAGNFSVLLLGRTIQGIGGGGIFTMNLVIITDLVPLRFRPKYFGISFVCSSAGMIVGPLIGGVIAQKSTWRLIFYINFPFCLIGLATAPWMIHNQPKQWSSSSPTPYFSSSSSSPSSSSPSSSSPSSSPPPPPPLLQRLREEVDWVGLLLFLASTTVFLIAVTWGGHNYPWASYQTLLPLLLGVLGIAVAIVWEARYATAPFIPRSMLFNRPLMTIYGCTLLQGLLLYAHVLYLALWLLSLKGRSPLMTGTALLPIFFGMIAASIVVGLAVSRIGYWKWTVWLGWLIHTLAAGLLLLLDATTPTATWAALFVVLGLGQGALLIGHNLGVQGIVAGRADTAHATVLFSFVRSVGFCLGLAIGGAVLENRLSRLLLAAGLSPSIASDMESYIFEFMDSAESNAYAATVFAMFGEALTFLFQVMTGVSGAGLLLSLTIRGHFSLRRDEQASE